MTRKDTPEGGTVRYWLRNSTGRVWGPFDIAALGRVNVGSKDAVGRVEVSTDGNVFEPIARHPDVQEVLENAARPKAVAPRPPPPPPPPRPAAEQTAVSAPVEEPPGPPDFGTLDEHSSIELYARVASERLTGRFAVSTDGGNWAIYFKNGTPERVESPDGAQALARFLVDRGAVPQDEIDRALEMTGGDAGELLDALVALQLVQPQDVFTHLGEHATAELERAIALYEGDFVWEEGVRAPQPAFPMGARWALLSRGVRALAPGAIRRRLGERGHQAVYPASDPRVPVADLGLTAQEARVAQHFDGTRSPELIARDLPGEREVVMRTALLLGDAGCLSFGPTLESKDGARLVREDDAPIVEKRSAFEPSAPVESPPETNVGIGRVAIRTVAVRSEPLPEPPPVVAKAVFVPPVKAPSESVSSKAARAAVPRPPPPDRHALRKLLDEWKGANHFEVLGVGRSTTSDKVKAAYFTLARRYHPDTLVEAEADEELRGLYQDLAARLNEAYSTLGNDAERAAYAEALDSGGTELVDLNAIFQAEEDLQKGIVLAKGRKYPEARALLEQVLSVLPNDAEARAWLAWANFAASPDKRAAYPAGVKACEEALGLNAQTANAHLFIGRMSKLVGDVKRAARAYKAVLDVDENNIEAMRELRLLTSK